MPTICRLIFCRRHGVCIVYFGECYVHRWLFNSFPFFRRHSLQTVTEQSFFIAIRYCNTSLNSSFELNKTLFFDVIVSSIQKAHSILSFASAKVDVDTVSGVVAYPARCRRALFMCFQRAIHTYYIYTIKL